MSIDIDKNFKNAQYLLDQVALPLQLVGVWPDKRTISSDIRFILFIVYYGTHLFMEYCDLIAVWGDLQAMVTNLIETSLESMIIVRLLALRFRKIFIPIIKSIKENVVDKNYTDSKEREIYIKYSTLAANYHKNSMRLCSVAALSWYIMPLQRYVWAWINNSPMVLETPYRIRTGFNISSVNRIIFIYIYQMPMIYPPLCYVATFGFVIVAVTNICGRLAILSYKITNLTAVYKESVLATALKDHVRQHLNIIQMSESIDNAFHLIFLFELISTTALLGLLSYSTMVNWDDAEPMALVTFTTSSFTVIALIYVNCLMGEYLASECSNLLAAYYECKWYDMPVSIQYWLIMCMLRAQNFSKLTAGKFYIYSLSSFTAILKSSLTYVSLLRTML
ncbi:hypothetical protein PV325_001912 [Microctonus aethiopoides]|uniref:Odorant receptor n=1 Tax=Microctonus aethiopoides TaxID=144406 RepID=A0AA39FYP7_9HYME|nr:hypothetical protein PV325_001912 [Microctonus aethiopoides]KAK0178307.1 hypothetical protein PV328_002269 [Microctonus aethiopoides]